MTTSPPPRLEARDLHLGYDDRLICDGVSLAIFEGSFTAVIGPNGCGKSTLLRSLCRLLRPRAGQVCLDGQDIRRMPTRDLARQVGLLPQSAEAPGGIRVADLVGRGRYPHQGPFRQWSAEDEDVVAQAMQATGVADLAGAEVDQLSGGQRQRVWIAMVLAQETPVLLLDEPTTFLDIAHQIELMDLLRRLNRDKGQTIVMVLHDLNQASRYADRLVMMANGRIAAEGPPHALMTPALLREVFGLACLIIDDPVSHTPLIVPC